MITENWIASQLARQEQNAVRTGGGEGPAKVDGGGAARAADVADDLDPQVPPVLFLRALRLGVEER